MRLSVSLYETIAMAPLRGPANRFHPAVVPTRSGLLQLDSPTERCRSRRRLSGSTMFPCEYSSEYFFGGVTLFQDRRQQKFASAGSKTGGSATLVRSEEHTSELQSLRHL